MAASSQTALQMAFVSRVNLRMLIRIVRLCRSLWHVLTCFGSGLPVILCFRVPMHSAGL